MATPVQDLITRIANLGVPERAAETYVHLVRAGRSKPGEIALRMDIPRADAYRRLDDAVTAGLAHRSMTRPVRYSPVPFDQVLDALQERTHHRQRQIESAKEDLAPELDEIHPEQVPPSEARFDVVEGREATFGLLVRRYAAALEAELLVVNTHPRAVAWARDSGVWQAVGARRGVRKHILVRRCDEVRQDLAKTPAMPGAEVRWTDAEETVRFNILDRKEILFLAAFDPSGYLGAKGDVAIHTNGPGFVTSHALLFDRLWRDAEPAPEAGVDSASEDAGTRGAQPSVRERR